MVRENPERNVIPMMDPSDISLDIQILTFSEGVLDVFLCPNTFSGGVTGCLGFAYLPVG